FNGGSVDLKQREIEFRNAQQETRRVKVQTAADSRAESAPETVSAASKSAPTGIIVKTPDQTVVATADNAVKTIDTAGNTTTTTDITKPSIETPQVVVTQEQVNVKHTDGTPDTIITSTN